MSGLRRTRSGSGISAAPFWSSAVAVAEAGNAGWSLGATCVGSTAPARDSVAVAASTLFMIVSAVSPSAETKTKFMRAYPVGGGGVFFDVRIARQSFLFSCLRCCVGRSLIRSGWDRHNQALRRRKGRLPESRATVTDGQCGNTGVMLRVAPCSLHFCAIRSVPASVQIHAGFRSPLECSRALSGWMLGPDPALNTAEYKNAREQARLVADVLASNKALLPTGSDSPAPSRRPRRPRSGTPLERSNLRSRQLLQIELRALGQRLSVQVDAPPMVPVPIPRPASVILPSAQPEVQRKCRCRTR